MSKKIDVFRRLGETNEADMLAWQILSLQLLCILHVLPHDMKTTNCHIWNELAAFSNKRIRIASGH